MCLERCRSVLENAPFYSPESDLMDSLVFAEVEAAFLRAGHREAVPEVAETLDVSAFKHIEDSQFKPGFRTIVR